MYPFGIFCKSWTREREWIKNVYTGRREVHVRVQESVVKNNTSKVCWTVLRGVKRSRSVGSRKGSEFRSQHEQEYRLYFSEVSSYNLHRLKATKENVEASPHNIVIIISSFIRQRIFFQKCGDLQSASISLKYYHSQIDHNKSYYNKPVLIIVY